ncbi:keratin, type I cytoskeletal 9-like [Ostrinia furnacalis]|uniref:keratin, type I cytoskeletal 9-like n=1 Tax=Ostrinia furnacalis TaxID=93504 RepID=UPI00103F8498|nr:keratin, type I cytoskeletal 9-like [Ostrinia furnacalis]
MKFTVVLIAALSVSASWAIKIKKADEPKDKREAPVGYPSHSSHSFQAPSVGHGDASAISIGAGYSVGGAKPSFSLGGHGDGGYQLGSEGLPGSGHATIQLAPITLQPNHGFAASDLSQLMSQLSHGLNSGALQIQTGGEGYQQADQGGHEGQELSLPQYSFNAPKLQQQYAVSEHQSSVPSYAAGTKGLGSYSTGPVLFSPSDSHGNAPALTYGQPNSGHSLGGSSSGGHSYAIAPSSGHSFGALSSGGHSFANAPSSGHSFGGLSSGGHSFGEGAIALNSGHGHSFPGLSLGNGGHSFGGAIKGFGGATYGVPSKTSFKPSAFIGASVQGESGHGSSGHGLSGLSGSYGAPSFGSLGGGSHGFSLSSGGHGASLGGSFGGSFGGGSSKFVAPSYLPAKSEGFGSSLESVASFASEGHLGSAPGASYGSPSSSYGHPSNSAHAASSSSPQYYVPTKSSFPSFGSGSSSYKAPYSGHGAVSSFSSGHKHGFGGHSSHGPRYGHPKGELQGAHSETSYNTIKYSEELKPRAQ